jgi:hypothetical protein
MSRLVANDSGRELLTVGEGDWRRLLFAIKRLKIMLTYFLNTFKFLKFR